VHAADTKWWQVAVGGEVRDIRSVGADVDIPWSDWQDPEKRKSFQTLLGSRWLEDATPPVRPQEGEDGGAEGGVDGLGGMAGAEASGVDGSFFNSTKVCLLNISVYIQSMFSVKVSLN
jgi:hypothetical protein